MNYSIIEYPALVYKNEKSNVFVANCIFKKLIGFGKTEVDAVKNLETILNKAEKEYFIKVKPLRSLVLN